MEQNLYPFCAIYKKGDEYGWVFMPSENRANAIREAVLKCGPEKNIVLSVHLLKKEGYLPPETYVDEDKMNVEIHEKEEELNEWCRALQKKPASIRAFRKENGITPKQSW